MSEKVEYKIWGKVRHIFGEEASVSLLQVNDGFCCSIHKHAKRYNAFWVVSGALRIVYYQLIDDKPVKVSEEILYSGENTVVPPEIYHRFEVLKSGNVAEIYWTKNGSRPDKNDIIRLDEGGKL